MSVVGYLALYAAGAVFLFVVVILVVSMRAE